MEKIFVIIIILYAFFVVIYFQRIGTEKKRKKDIIGRSGSIQETGRLKADIVGKSKFDLSMSEPQAAKATPQAATPPKSEKGMEKPDIFAPSNEEKPSATIPPEELDEAFSDTPDNEDNKPMDIDYPLEYEATEENESEPENEEEETEEVEGTAQAAFASGVKFEDLGNVIRTINKADEATQEQKEKAGNTLLEIRRTDMFEQVVSGKRDAKKIVADLMAESLADFHRRKDMEAGNAGNSNKAPDSFDMRDFA